MARRAIHARETVLPKRHPTEPRSAIFSHDERELFIVRRDSLIDRFSVATGDLIETIGRFRLYCSMPDGVCATKLGDRSVLFVVKPATISNPRTIGLFFDVETKETIQDLVLRCQPSFHCRTAPQADGSVVLAYHTNVRLFRTRAHARRMRHTAISSPHKIVDMRTFNGMHLFELSPNGVLIALGEFGSQDIKVVDMLSRTLVSTINCTTLTCDVAFNSDSNNIAVLCDDSKISVWTPQGVRKQDYVARVPLAVKATFVGAGASERILAYSQVGRIAWINSHTGTQKIVGRTCKSDEPHHTQHRLLAVSSTGSRVAISYSDKHSRQSICTTVRWNDRTHHLFSASFRRRTFLLMCIRQRLDTQRRSHSIPRLPTEMWLLILEAFSALCT